MQSNSLKMCALAIVAGIVLSGCGGRSVQNTVAPSAPSVPQSGARLVLTGTVDGTGPRFLSGVRRAAVDRFHRLALSLKSVSVTATLYPGDAGSQPISNTLVIATTTIPSTASVSLSNVPVHNNEWAFMQFTGNAADGSHVALGELAGVVNVTSATTNTASLTETTSQTFQVFMDLATAGALSTNDFDTNATLATTLHTDIGAAPVDPTTHLFSSGELNTLYNSIAPKFERDVTITASPATNGSYVLLRDYTNLSELNATSNIQGFIGQFTLGVPFLSSTSVIGGGLGQGSFNVLVPAHTQLTSPAPLPVDVTAYITGGIGAQTIRNVYGGHMLVGATNNQYSFFATLTPPYIFTGGFLAFAGHAPGAFSATVTTASTLKTVVVSDPAGYAFGGNFFASLPPGLGAFYTMPFFGTGSLSGTTFSSPAASASRVGLPIPYSSTSTTISVDSFNPWDIATTNEEVCGGVKCWVLGTTPPAIMRPFADAGTKLTYFAWKPSGKATAISQTSGGYSVSISGAGTATLTSSTATVLLPRQRIFISSSLVSPTPSTWTVTATDAGGHIYSDSTTSVLSGTATITMDSVAVQTTTKTIAISFTTTIPSPVTINSIVEQ